MTNEGNNLEHLEKYSFTGQKKFKSEAVTGSKQNQMVSSAAGLTVLMQYSPNQGLLM